LNNVLNIQAAASQLFPEVGSKDKHNYREQISHLQNQVKHFQDENQRLQQQLVSKSAKQPPNMIEAQYKECLCEIV
jgi:gas vesicle protein